MSSRSIGNCRRNRSAVADSAEHEAEHQRGRDRDHPGRVGFAGCRHAEHPGENLERSHPARIPEQQRRLVSRRRFRKLDKPLDACVREQRLQLIAARVAGPAADPGEVLRRRQFGHALDIPAHELRIRDCRGDTEAIVQVPQLLPSIVQLPPRLMKSLPDGHFRVGRPGRQVGRQCQPARFLRVQLLL
jgi:hypothetical protein